MGGSAYHFIKNEISNAKVALFFETLHKFVIFVSFLNTPCCCIVCLQKEKEVLALLSRLDLQNVHFTNSPPGMSSYVILAQKERFYIFFPMLISIHHFLVINC